MSCFNKRGHVFKNCLKFKAFISNRNTPSKNFTNFNPAHTSQKDFNSSAIPSCIKGDVLYEIGWIIFITMLHILHSLCCLHGHNLLFIEDFHHSILATSADIPSKCTSNMSTQTSNSIIPHSAQINFCCNPEIQFNNFADDQFDFNVLILQVQKWMFPYLLTLAQQ